MKKPKLVRKPDNFRLFGLSDAVSDAFDLDPMWIRAGLIGATALCPLPTIIGYAIAHLIVPSHSEVPKDTTASDTKNPSNLGV